MRFRLVPLTLVLFLFTSCSDDFEQAAVTATSSGTFQVLFRPCDSEHQVEKVQLLVVDGPVVGDDDDEVVWEVVAASAVVTLPIMRFEPGESIPAGYAETVRLDAPSTGGEVSVYLETKTGGGFAASFEWGRLESGILLTGDGPKTAEEWFAYAEEGCGR